MIYDRKEAITKLRSKLKNGHASIGSWIQMNSTDVSEIMGKSSYDWVAIDLEHGSISFENLPDLFRSLELGHTLPLARIPEATPTNCKRVLDAGAAGIIVPNIVSSDQLNKVRSWCAWPPAGTRGVGYSRANLYGKNFSSYNVEAQTPFLVAQIEHKDAVDNLEEILRVDGLDAIFIGPYDLSASIGITGQFDNIGFTKVVNKIVRMSLEANIPLGQHIVQPDEEKLKEAISSGYSFIAYSIDAVFLNNSVICPEVQV